MSIGEYTGVVTLKRIVQNITTQGVENDVLTRKIVRSRIQGIKAVIESESLGLVPTTSIENNCRYICMESRLQWIGHVTRNTVCPYVRGIRSYSSIRESDAILPAQNIREIAFFVLLAKIIIARSFTFLIASRLASINSDLEQGKKM